jgi:ribonucleases P/MRP protein subunit RPP40
MVMNNKHFNVELAMNGRKLAKTDKERDLGIIICSNLKWNHQATLAANKATTVLSQLSRTFKCWSIKTFRLLYGAFVRPHLEYAITAWCPHTKRDIEILERVQRRATKLVTSLKDLSYEQRLEMLDLSTLRKRRERADVIEYYKISNGLSNVEWHNANKLTNSLFLGGPASGIRGHKHRLTKQATKINQREHFLLNRVVDIWNKLPPDVVNAKSKNSFKKRLDDFYKSC